jgi:ABC-type transport system substrate-binding protein
VPIEEHALRRWIRAVDEGRRVVGSSWARCSAWACRVHWQGRPPVTLSLAHRSPDLQAYMTQFVSWEVACKANNWSGQNVVRWGNTEYDRLWKQAAMELDPVKRARCSSP